MTHRNKYPHKKAVLLLGIIMLVILGVLVLRMLPAGENMQDQQAAETQTLDNLAASLGVYVELRDSPYWSWVDEEKNILPLTGSEFLIGTSGINGVGKYGNLTTDELSMVNVQFLEPISASAEAFFMNDNFTKNTLNTMPEPDEFGTIIYAYENDQLKCLVSLSEMTDPFGRFFCGRIDTEQMALRSEFKEIFPMVYKQGQQPPLLRIEKVVGDFALGNYAEGTGPGGYTFMAKKIDNKWNVVWKGQDIALCSDMLKYQIPKEIYGECYQG